MANQIKQADKLVNGAVSIFDKGVQDIAKANELISASITEDERKLLDLAAKKVAIDEEVKSIHLGISLKENKIKENVNLLDKLSGFTSAE